MSKVTTYSSKNCQSTLDGRTVRGLWEGDDAITVARRSERSTPMVGADGDSIVSNSADESALITLRLQHTSAAHAYLNELNMAMSEGATPKFPFSIRDIESGEGGSAAECVIMQTPSVNTGSRNAGVREWQIFAGRWESNPVNYLG